MMNLRKLLHTVGSGLVAFSTYASAKRTRMNVGWGTRDTTDPNRAIREDAYLLRERAWQLDRDNPIAGGTTDALVDGVLSSPIRPISAAKDRNGALAKDWNKAADECFRAWAEEPTYCDLTGHDDFAALQDLVLRTVDLAGEAIVLRHVRENDEGIPSVRIEVCEPDVLGTGRGWLRATATGGVIRDGVTYDSDMRPVSYQIKGLDGAMVTWKAEDVLHIYQRRRPGQVFGEPSSARCGEFIYQVGEYQSTELKQANALARFFGVATSQSGGILGQSDTDGTSEAGHSVSDVEIGQVLNLNPGETFTQLQQTRPGSTMDQFQGRVLSGFAIGRGMTYEQVSGDYARTNYSSAQMSALAKLPTANKRRAFVRDRFVAEVRFWVIQQGILDGYLDPIEGVPVREYWRCAWSMPGDRHIDQAKQATSDDVQLKQGRIAITDLHSRDGNPTEEQVAKIAAAMELFKAAGISTSWMQVAPDSVTGDPGLAPLDPNAEGTTPEQQDTAPQEPNQ